MKIRRNIALLAIGSCLILYSPGVASEAPNNSKDQKLNQKPPVTSTIGDKHRDASKQAINSEVSKSNSVSMGWPQWIGTTKDILVAIAAIIASVVACLGLSTWKRQLKGQTQYDLARRILRLCYRYRDAIKGVRDPFMLTSEFRFPPEVRAETLEERRRAYLGRRGAYEARWERVSAARMDLYPELLEAEVLWGEKINDLIRPIYALEAELAAAVREEMQVTDPDAREDDVRYLMDQESSQRRRETLYARYTRDDPFQTNFNDGLVAVSAVLKEHLSW